MSKAELPSKETLAEWRRLAEGMMMASEQAITEAWLREVGFELHEGRLDSPVHPETGDSLSISNDMQECYFGDDRGHWVEIRPAPKTRSDIINLLAVLGLPVKGGSRGTN